MPSNLQTAFKLSSYLKPTKSRAAIAALRYCTAVRSLKRANLQFVESGNFITKRFCSLQGARGCAYSVSQRYVSFPLLLLIASRHAI